MAKLENYIIKPPSFPLEIQALPPQLSEEDKERLIQLHKKLAELKQAHEAAVAPILNEMLRISAKYRSRYVMVLKD